MFSLLALLMLESWACVGAWAFGWGLVFGTGIFPVVRVSFLLLSCLFTVFVSSIRCTFSLFDVVLIGYQGFLFICAQRVMWTTRGYIYVDVGRNELTSVEKNIGIWPAFQCESLVALPETGPLGCLQYCYAITNMQYAICALLPWHFTGLRVNTIPFRQCNSEGQTTRTHHHSSSTARQIPAPPQAHGYTPACPSTATKMKEHPAQSGTIPRTRTC